MCTCRVLEFPATAPRRPATAAATTAAASRPRPASTYSLLKPAGPGAYAFAATPGSALGTEPAYKTALARLTQRPLTAAGSGAAPPGSALARRPATAAVAAAASAQPPSSRLDALLDSRPSSAQPPSSRLEALLSRPLPAAATAGVGATAASRRQPAAAGAVPASGIDALAALSPVPEEWAPISTAGKARAAALWPQRAADLPTSAAAPADAAPAAVPAAVPAASRSIAPAGMDPDLGHRLRERIEAAKASHCPPLLLSSRCCY